MQYNFAFQDINTGLPFLCSMLLQTDIPEVGSRDGRTKELTFAGITYTNPLNRELLLPHRKHNLAAQIAETAWVLAGRNDIAFLSHYLPRAENFSDDGLTWRAGYGRRLRNWKDSTGGIDQLSYVVEMLRAAPSSRQAVMSIWDPTIDTFPGKDIPCNDWLHFLSREGRLDLHVAVRSNDLIWGHTGVNMFEWSVLLEVVAGMVGLGVGRLHFSISSLHLYDRHWTRAAQIAKEDPILRYVDASPRFDATGLDDMKAFNNLMSLWFEAEKAIRTGNTLAPTLVRDFPEPMLQSWLRVLQWWWTSDWDYLKPLIGTRLEQSIHYSVQPRTNPGTALPEWTNPGTALPEYDPAHPEQVAPAMSFIDYVDNLHREKAKAYGDSWKRRGEMFSILPNIARKVDRFGRADIDDENATDTAIDLLVYLIKYRWYLADQGFPAPMTTLSILDADLFGDSMDALRMMLERLEDMVQGPYAADYPATEHTITELLGTLENMVAGKHDHRHMLVDSMLVHAFGLARTRYNAQ